METRGHYGDMVGTADTEHQIVLSPEERAAILKAYDNGVAALQNPTERQSLDTVLAKLKDSIWP